jgi:hypothetical protein
VATFAGHLASVRARLQKSIQNNIFITAFLGQRKADAVAIVMHNVKQRHNNGRSAPALVNDLIQTTPSLSLGKFHSVIRCDLQNNDSSD